MGTALRAFAHPTVLSESMTVKPKIAEILSNVNGLTVAVHKVAKGIVRDWPVIFEGNQEEVGDNKLSLAANNLRFP